MRSNNAKTIELENGMFSLDNENKEEWTETEFVTWSRHTSNNISQMCLRVNWGTKKVSIRELSGQDGFYLFKIRNGCISEYLIPENTDYSEFPEYYKQKIQPLIQELSKKYTSYQDNQMNWYGKFADDGSLEEDIEESCNDAPTHDIVIYPNVIEMYHPNACMYGMDGMYRENILAALCNFGFDIVSADLDNDATIKRAVKILVEENFEDRVFVAGGCEFEVKDILTEIQSIVKDVLDDGDPDDRIEMKYIEMVKQNRVGDTHATV